MALSRMNAELAYTNLNVMYGELREVEEEGSAAAHRGDHELAAKLRGEWKAMRKIIREQEAYMKRNGLE